VFVIRWRRCTNSLVCAASQIIKTAGVLSPNNDCKQGMRAALKGSDKKYQEAKMESGSRSIKKYPNRRLYDTVESRYITLADVRRLVQQNIEFSVIEKKTQTDITRSILLQVIAEQEHTAEPVMSREFLAQVIRSYGTPLQHGIAGALDQSIRQVA
jgi:polyhydroxyalkanoate synthesis repressor PhaR